MHGPTLRWRRVVKAAAIPVALVVSATIVWQSSYAAFTATTDSPGNQWSAGALALTNDTTGTFATTGTLMFTPALVKPGDTGQWCVNVKNAGSLGATAANPIKFYAPLPASLSTNLLAQNLTFAVVESTTTVTGGNAGSCTGFTAGTSVYSGLLSAVPATYAAGAAPTGAGVLAAGATKGYQITWTMPTTTPNTVAGQTLTGVDFTWAMQIGS